MKYSQFLEFSELLEKNNTSLDEWKKDPSVELIKEEDEDEGKLDTKKGNIITKKGRARRGLNKEAKKLQKEINISLVDKFFGMIFKHKTEVYKKLAEMLRDKQPKEVIAALRPELKNLNKLQTKQLNLLEKQAEKMISNKTQNIENYIEKKGLKEATALDMKTYWSLLTTQLHMQLLQELSKRDSKLLDEVIEDPKIKRIATEISKKVNASIAEKLGGLEEAAKEKKEKVKEMDAKEESGEELAKDVTSTTKEEKIEDEE